jgi:hypothetical protein
MQVRISVGGSINPLADAFVGSSPTSPAKSPNSRPLLGAIFMSHMLHDFLKQFQWPSTAAKNSMQHERDMERS